MTQQEVNRAVSRPHLHESGYASPNKSNCPESSRGNRTRAPCRTGCTSRSPAIRSSTSSRSIRPTHRRRQSIIAAVTRRPPTLIDEKPRPRIHPQQILPQIPNQRQPVYQPRRTVIQQFVRGQPEFVQSIANLPQPRIDPLAEHTVHPLPPFDCASNTPTPLDPA